MDKYSISRSHLSTFSNPFLKEVPDKVPQPGLVKGQWGGFWFLLSYLYYFPHIVPHCHSSSVKRALRLVAQGPWYNAWPGRIFLLKLVINRKWDRWKIATRTTWIFPWFLANWPQTMICIWVNTLIRASYWRGVILVWRLGNNELWHKPQDNNSGQRNHCPDVCWVRNKRLQTPAASCLNFGWLIDSKTFHHKQ